MQKIFGFIIAGLCMAASIHAATVNLTGTVTDSATGTPIAGAVVWLSKASLLKVAGVKDTTNASGVYTLAGETTSAVKIASLKTGIASELSLRNNALCFTISSNKVHAQVNLYNVSGACVSNLLDKQLDRGDYTVGLPASQLASGLYIVKVQANSQATGLLPVSCVNGRIVSPVGTQINDITSSPANSLAKTSAGAVDAVVVSAAGYKPVNKLIATYSGTNNFALATQTFAATRGGQRLISAAGKSFMMGGTIDVLDGSYTLPRHKVTFTKDFYLDTTEVTQAEYEAVMHATPSTFKSASDHALHPVENVSWFDAVRYCNARSKKEGLDTALSWAWVKNGTQLGWVITDTTKNGYRLPTEAEWEYACRAGSVSGYFWGEKLDSLQGGEFCWYFGNCDSMTHAVATKLPNAWGLYDMTGNVWEWVQDWSGNYDTTAVTDPIGWWSTTYEGFYKVIRGGDWEYDYCFNDQCNKRAAFRSQSGPGDGYKGIGFRCARKK